MVELVLHSISTSSVTKIVLSYEWWDHSSVRSVYFCAWTDIIIRPNFIMSSCKCPNMFPWCLSVSEANTIDIVVINSAATIPIIDSKCIGGVILISNDLPTDSGVFDSIERECGGHTSTAWSAACPLW